jgi:hypothetical protein
MLVITSHPETSGASSIELDRRKFSAYLGYPTPVNPLQPIYAPFGNSGIKSSGCASFFSNDGRATRAFRAAEAVTATEEAMLELLNCRRSIAARKKQEASREAKGKKKFTSDVAGRMLEDIKY